MADSTDNNSLLWRMKQKRQGKIRREIVFGTIRYDRVQKQKNILVRWPKNGLPVYGNIENYRVKRIGLKDKFYTFASIKSLFDYMQNESKQHILLVTKTLPVVENKSVTY